MKSFEARAVYVGDIEGVFMVALSSELDGNGPTLMIQRALEFNVQDIALDQNTYCLCNEDAATHCGGVTSWFFSGVTLTILLDPTAHQHLGVSDGFELRIPNDRIDEVRAGLESVLVDIGQRA